MIKVSGILSLTLTCTKATITSYFFSLNCKSMKLDETPQSYHKVNGKLKNNNN